MAVYEFNYTATLDSLLEPSIFKKLSKIHEGRGMEIIAVNTVQDLLSRLNSIAKTKSAASTCRIEDLKATDKHVRELVSGKADAASQSDAHILGARHAIETVDSSYDFLRLSPAVILQLHNELFADVKQAAPGKWKGSDELLAMQHGHASSIPQTNFKRYHGVQGDMVAPKDIAPTIRSLCSACTVTLKAQVYDPLLVSLLFSLDIICIHPFDEGTGQMSRLLMQLVLEKSGFSIGRYISIDAAIEKRKEEYFQALKQCAHGWNTQSNECRPYINFMLDILEECYSELESRICALTFKTGNEKTIRTYFQQLEGEASKREILEENPTMSQKTLERMLQKLQREGFIEKTGAARATKYRRRKRVQ